MDQRTIISLLRRASLPATICLLVLVGVVGVFGFLRPAHATSADPAVEGVELPPVFDNLPPANQRTKTAGGTDTATFTFAPFTAHEQATFPSTDTAPETSPGSFPATCNLNAPPFTSLTPSITLPIGSFLFKCTATDTTDNSSNPSIAFIALTVVEPGPVFDNLPGNQTKNADGTDTATFTFAPVTAHEPGELGENISVVCKTTVTPIVTITSPITLHTHALGQGQNGGSYMFICTATDTTDGSFFNGFFTFTVLDEKTVLNLPANQTATAGSTDTALVSYGPVTATETPSGESDNILGSTGCRANNGATSNNFFVFSGTFNLGVTTVTCDANDIPNAPGKDGTNPPGQSATEMSFTVTVADEHASLSNPGNQTAVADATDTALVSYATVTATVTPNGESESITPTCTADNGASSGDGFVSSGTFNLGVTTVTCNATDNVDGTIPSSTDAQQIQFTVTVADEPTSLSNPGPQTAVADATDTALVSYPTVTATETPSGESESITPTCTADNGASSGDGFVSSGTFNVGVTTVTCNATDNVDGTTPPGTDAQQIQFTVTVTDQPVTLTVPPQQVANATSPAGATVTYQPGPVTAVEDGEAETISITCTVNNGATSGDGFVSSGNFPIGDTTVTCTAADPDGLSAGPMSFTVHVKGAAEQISDLISLVNSFNLSPKGIQTSFDSQLQAVLTDLAANNTAQACSDLTSFINHAKAQSGKKLTVAQANQLLAAATRIQAVLGC